MAQHEILSPLPGIFYRQPAPDKPPYKDAGDQVAEGDVIGLVEVMKQFSEGSVLRSALRIKGPTSS